MESGGSEEDVLVFVAADQGLAVEVQVRGEEAFREFDVAGGAGVAAAFLPAGHCEKAGAADLAVEGVIKLLLGVDLSVVDVDGGEEELVGVAGGESEGHRVDFAVAFLQLEDGESVVLELREFVPGLFRQAEAGVEAGEVGEFGDKGGFVGADGVDLEGLCFRRRAQGSDRALAAGDRDGEGGAEMCEEFRVAGEVDEGDGILLHVRRDGKRKDHGKFGRRADIHLVDNALATGIGHPGEDPGVLNEGDVTGEAAHGGYWLLVIGDW